LTFFQPGSPAGPLAGPPAVGSPGVALPAGPPAAGSPGGAGSSPSSPFVPPTPPAGPPAGLPGPPGPPPVTKRLGIRRKLLEAPLPELPVGELKNDSLFREHRTMKKQLAAMGFKPPHGNKKRKPSCEHFKNIVE